MVITLQVQYIYNFQNFSYAVWNAWELIIILQIQRFNLSLFHALKSKESSY